MKRLVYSPQINAWVKTDHGIFDLSPYITDFQITRKRNQISSAQLTFRNPKIDDGDGKPRFLFTQHKVDGGYGPMLHPMDPIVITLTRIKGYPVQVFTGYCDGTPYIQIYPGVAKLSASCSLKRLLYTYWDPGLPFVMEYLADNGWLLKEDGTTINVQSETSEGQSLNDSSIGYLLYKILMDVGGWEHDDIYVQGLPGDQITQIVQGLYEDITGESKASFQKMQDFLSRVIGADHGFGGAGNGALTSDASNPTTPYDGKQGKLSPSEAKSYAKSQLSNHGWGEDQWSDLETLWEHESNWKWDADNPTSDAYGIPQSLPGSKMATDGGGADWETNAVTQINWGLNYIKQRYGSPKQAWAFWQTHNWY